MSVSIAVYGMSSQVQWLLRLHCADKVARCYSPEYFLRDKHILVGIHTYLDKIAREFVLKPPLSHCLFASPFFRGNGARVSFVRRILVCFLDPCM